MNGKFLFGGCNNEANGTWLRSAHSPTLAGLSIKQAEKRRALKLEIWGWWCREGRENESIAGASYTTVPSYNCILRGESTHHGNVPECVKWHCSYCGSVWGQLWKALDGCGASFVIRGYLGLPCESSAALEFIPPSAWATAIVVATICMHTCVGLAREEHACTHQHIFMNG